MVYVGDDVREHGIYEGSDVIFEGNVVAYTSGYAVNLNGPNSLIQDNIMMGAGVTIKGATSEILLGPDGTNNIIQRNRLYTTAADKTNGGTMKLGYASGTGYNLVVENNTIVGSSSNFYGSFSTFRFHGNSVHMQDSSTAWPVFAAHNGVHNGFTINRNRYTARGNPVKVDDGSSSQLTFAQWRTKYPSMDTDTISTDNSLPTNAVYVIGNKYEAGRANIAIYNWNQATSVSVDISNVDKTGDGIGDGPLLSIGDSYQLHNVLDYVQDVLTGTYHGSPISVQMTGHTVAQPQAMAKPTSSPFPEFGAFVLIKTNTTTTGSGPTTTRATTGMQSTSAGTGTTGALPGTSTGNAQSTETEVSASPNAAEFSMVAVVASVLVHYLLLPN
jgi:hypothetical protein